MVSTRVIPCLLLSGDSLVKTVKFKNADYIGDPVNTVRIFNELEVDELCFLDIEATKEQKDPNFEILERIASECFMPLSYGGGINSIDQVDRIYSIGFEKVVVNSAAFTKPELLEKISAKYGAQALVGSLDYKRSLFGKYEVWSNGATRKQKQDPVSWAKRLTEFGVGEILLTSIDREGTWKGMDLDLIKEIQESVEVPVIANGGAGNVADLKDAKFKGKASAIAVGSMVVYQQKGMGVLVNFPSQDALTNALNPMEHE